MIVIIDGIIYYSDIRIPKLFISKVEKSTNFKDMKIAQSKTRDQFPLSKRKILKKTVGSLLGWIIIALVIFGILVFSVGPKNGSNTAFWFASQAILTGILVLISSVVIFFLIYFYQRWYYAVYFYDLTPDYIVIRKGPITPQEITIPYERIQDVYVDQDLLDRFFGLYDVHLSSATISSGMQAHIDGVQKPAADGLRAALLQTVSERISKRRVLAQP